MKLRKPLVIILVLLAVFFLAGQLLPKITETSYTTMRTSTKAFDVQAVQDGSYVGKAFLMPVSVRASVTVAGGRIVSIELLKHFNGQGQPAEALIPEVVKAQSLGVDVVAGATHSSLTILKALENALSRGIR
ncbi:MAG: FMN-binding protein [Clostridia bacterium]|nr:FMN-binding protein [Spirochaetia bacterium]